MKNVIGLEYYREYQRKIEEMQHNVMNNRSDNDADSAILLVHNDEERQTITKIFGVTAVCIVILSSIILTIFKMINKWNLMWIIAVLFGCWGVTFIVLFNINKSKKKKIIKEKEILNQKEIAIVNEYKELQEKFYSIVVYVICINEYYHTLIKLDGENLKNAWQRITKREIELINSEVNYNISIASYQQYFNEWLAKQEIYG